MTKIQQPARERQALDQVGVTAISPTTSWVAVLAFLLTIFGVPLGESMVSRSGEGNEIADETGLTEASIWHDFRTEVASCLAQIGTEGFFTANRQLLAAMQAFESRLEDEASLRRWLLPRIQWRLASSFGLGNEQVYIGRYRWLFFRADIDHVAGPGFLDPRVLESRRRGGDAWLAAPQPDPLVALQDLHRQLVERNIHLVVMPTPVKPTLEPQRFTARAGLLEHPLQNPSYASFIDRLEQLGIDVFDPAPLLVEHPDRPGEARYLRADTHWLPPVVDEIARLLAMKIEGVESVSAGVAGMYRRREVVVEGLGDTAQMLVLPADQTWIQPQRVSLQMVTDRAGKRWRSSREAEILLLGDSFTNVFSDPALGWGATAGLAEQLGFHLQRPVDRLAVNAGGALQARLALRREMEGGEDRLQGKKVVIYQFATRELSQGDWRLVEFPR